MSKTQLSELSLERVPGSPPTLPDTDLRALSIAYADVFAGDPWNEYTRCPQEGLFFGRQTQAGEPCASCNVSLVPAYPVEETMEYIRGEFGRPAAAAWLLFGPAGDRSVVGFSWGFAYSNPEEFAADKYRTPETQDRVVRALGTQGITDGLYYLSESGLLDQPDIRGRGLSREFHSRRLERAADLGMPAVQRTVCTGPMYRTSQRAGMIQVMGPEVEVDTAARRFIRTGRVANGIVDGELPDRVLFVKPQNSTN